MIENAAIFFASCNTFSRIKINLFILKPVLSFQIDDFQQQMKELESQLSQKTHEVEIMQTELKQVKEFRRKRAQMQKELEEVSHEIWCTGASFRLRLRHV